MNASHRELEAQERSAGRSVRFRELSQIGGAVNALDQRGDYLYVGIGPRLAVYHLTASDEPEQRSLSEPLQSTIQDLVVSDAGWVYAAVPGQGLVLFEGLPGGTAQQRGTMELGVSAASSLYLEADQLFVADGDVLRIDLSDPAAPVLVQRYFTPGFARDVQVSEDLLFVADSRPTGAVSGGTALVIDPASGRLVAELDAPDRVSHVATIDGDLILAARSTLLRYRRGEWRAPLERLELSGHFAEALEPGPGGLVLSLNPRQLLLLEIEGGRLRVRRSHARSVGSADVLALGDQLYVAHGREAGLSRLSLDAAGEIVDRWEGLMLTHAQSVLIEGNLAFVASEHAGVAVLDIADPFQPELLGRIDIPFPRPVMAIDADRLALVGPEGGQPILSSRDLLRIYDLSDPGLPRLLSTTALGVGECRAMAFDGHHFFALSSISGLWTLDLTRPEAPQRIGAVSSGANFAILEPERDRAFLFQNMSLAARGRLSRFDLGDPALPLSQEALFIAERYVFYADRIGDTLVTGGAQLSVYHAGPVAGLAAVQSRMEPGIDHATAITAADEAMVYSVVTELDGRVQLAAIDLSDPTRPLRAGDIPMRLTDGLGIRVGKVDLAGDLLLAPDEEAGLRFLRVEIEGQPRPTPERLPTLPSPAPVLPTTTPQPALPTPLPSPPPLPSVPGTAPESGIYLPSLQR